MTDLLVIAGAALGGLFIAGLVVVVALSDAGSWWHKGVNPHLPHQSDEDAYRKYDARR